MNTYIVYTTILLGFFISLSGCRDKSCASDEDCFRDEVCALQECTLAEDVQSTNNLSDGDGTCRVRANTTCEDPDETRENDSIGLATTVKAQGGCRMGEDDDFQPQSVELTGTLCQNEDADWYSVYLYQCQGLNYIVEFTLRPTIMCTDHRLEINGRINTKLSCEHEDVQCDRLEDGAQQIKLQVRSSGRFFTDGYPVQIGVVGVEGDYVQYPYTLSYEVRK